MSDIEVSFHLGPNEVEQLNRLMAELNAVGLNVQWSALLSMMIGQLMRAVGAERTAEILNDLVACQRVYLPSAKVKGGL